MNAGNQDTKPNPDSQCPGASVPRRRIPMEVLDEILSHSESPHGLVGPDGILQELIGGLVSRAMEGELSHHLGYSPGESPPSEQRNRRNGHSRKRLRTQHGPVDIEVPRDRDGSFSPQLVKPHQRSFCGFDEQILSLYARGMSTRDIRRHVAELYKVDISAELVSRVTDAVTDELSAWRSRPLERVYLVVYIDALVVKTRDKSGVRNKSVYQALGIKTDGSKEALGLWMQATEGAKYWLSILSELKERGVQDIFILCADGLKGLPEACEAAFPDAIFQTCIVHLIRSSTRYVAWKERKAVCRDLRAIYTAPTADDAELVLEAFDELWGDKYPMIAKAWRKRWSECLHR